MGWGLMEEMLDNGFEAAQLGILIVVLPGLAAFIAGFHLFYDVELTITAETVKFEKQRLFFRNVGWSEDLSEYNGILMEETDHSPRRGEQSYITYDLILRHKRNSKHNVLIYTSRKPAAFREQSEKFARLFGKPILLDAGDGQFTVREVDHLDKTSSELMREGKLEVDFEETKVLGFSNIQATRNDDALYISMVSGIGKATPIMFFLLAGLMPCLPLFVVEESVKRIFAPDLVIGFSGVFVMIGLALFLLSKSQTVLAVTPDKISKYQVVMGNKCFEKSVPTTQIEEVVVYQRKNEKFKGLQIGGDQDRIRCGQELTDEEREWVKNAVLSTIR